MRYDLLGRQTHRIDALGGVSYMGYDQVGNQVLALDELGNPTYFLSTGGPDGRLAVWARWFLFSFERSEVGSGSRT